MRAKLRLGGLAMAAACLAGLFPAGPVAAQGLFDDGEARRRIEVLRQQMNERDKALEARLEQAEKAAAAGADRSILVDLAGQIDALRGEIQKLRGQVEVVVHQMDTAERRQKELYLDIDTRLRKLEQVREQQAAAAASAAAQPPTAPAAPAAPPADTATEQRAYQAALDQFKLGNYAAAVSAMQGFLVTYPNSTLAPNAQYWVGMAYSGQRDYKNAISAQRQVLAAWPTSDKAPDAMLSIASAQETMGDRRAAQKTLEDLIARYPASSAAASAKQRIAATPARR